MLCSSPIFVSEELPHYIRTMEADLFYYEDSKNIDPPRENKDRIHKDWGAANNMKKKQHHGDASLNTKILMG